MKVRTGHDSVSMTHMVTLPLERKQSRPEENVSLRGGARRGLPSSEGQGEGARARVLTAVLVLPVVAEEESPLVTPFSHLFH